MPLHYDGEIRITKINMGPYNNNGYIVVCPETNEGVIIDTPAEPDKLLDQIGDTKIRAVLITHKHQDHLLGFQEITAAVDAPVGVGANDADGLPRSPDMELQDGGVVRFGNRAIQVLDTPGHTDGAACFLIGKHLFSGDTLFPGGPGKSRSPRLSTRLWIASPGSCWCSPTTPPYTPATATIRPLERPGSSTRPLRPDPIRKTCVAM